MKKIYENQNIQILNDSKEIILTIEDNEHTNNFIKNWYFLNNYINKPNFDNSFDIVHKNI